MKKRLLLLVMIISIFALTACSSNKEALEAETANPIMTKEQAEQTAVGLVELFDSVIAEGAEEEMKSYYVDFPLINTAYDTWKSSYEEIGKVIEIGKVQSEIDSEKAVVTIEVIGEKRNAVVETGIDLQYGPTDFTVNPEYAFSELMTKAALNTLIGMGTVFAVLILISLIISCFGIIPKLQDKFSKKSQPKEAVVKEPVIEQIIEKEELTDDLELVAVITAAVAATIAAEEGKSSSEGFRVRSIKRANTNKWQRA